MNFEKLDFQLWDAWNEGGGPKYPHEKVVQFILRNFSKSDRAVTTILDLGCGSGVHTHFLAQEGFRVRAFDISSVGVKNTLQRLERFAQHAECAVGGVDRIALPDESVDGAICSGVLDCAGPKKIAAAFFEVVRVLRPGGKAMFLFASDRDFRIENSGALPIYGFTAAEVEAALLPLRGVLQNAFMDRYVTTYEGKKIEQNDHLVTLFKR